MAGCAACSFEGGGSNAIIDAPVVDALGLEVVVPPDARPTDMGPTMEAMPTTACGGRLWVTDFGSDPTAEDRNGDAEPDWAHRNASAFPTSELSGGLWRPTMGSQPLDTQPRQVFTTRTLIDGRMRGTSVDDAALGALFWINVGYDSSSTFAPLYLSVRLQSGGTQLVRLFTKNPAGIEQLIEQGTVTGFVDFQFDIDPTNLTATYAVSGLTGSVANLMRQLVGPTPIHGWATIMAAGTGAELDHISVEVCP